MNKMAQYTEQELKDRCTPDAIKWMVELAEGFECNELGNCSYIHVEFNGDWWDDEEIFESSVFPLLIHRAFEGYNRLNKGKEILRCINFIGRNDTNYIAAYDDYQPQSLTHAECAILHCLLNGFEEVKK